MSGVGKSGSRRGEMEGKMRLPGIYQSHSHQSGWSGPNLTTFWDAKKFPAHMTVGGAAGRLVGSHVFSCEG